jgi:transcription antitermination factor NusG
MPILAAETSLYPADLFQRPPEATGDAAWWVLQTKARQEKAVARQLLAAAVSFYLPLVRQTHVYRGRRVQAHTALFPGYVFMLGTENDRLTSLATNRLSRILPVPAEENLAAQLLQVKRLIDSGAPLSVESRLAPGRRVRVRFGPLEGMEGTVLTRRGSVRLLVAINFIQRGASVEIDDGCLEPI